MTGWLMFALFVAIGFVDLGLGLIFVRSPDPAVGEATAAAGGNSPGSRRSVGRVMIVSAFLLWGLAGASATGILGPEFALPIFNQSLTE